LLIEAFLREAAPEWLTEDTAAAMDARLTTWLEAKG
jgi:hypothetical protein